MQLGFFHPSTGFLSHSSPSLPLNPRLPSFFLPLFPSHFLFSFSFSSLGVDGRATHLPSFFLWWDLGHSFRRNRLRALRERGEWRVVGLGPLDERRRRRHQSFPLFSPPFAFSSDPSPALLPSLQPPLILKEKGRRRGRRWPWRQAQIEGEGGTKTAERERWRGKEGRILSILPLSLSFLSSQITFLSNM